MWSDLWNFSETTAKFKMKYIYIDLVQDLKSGFSLCGLVLNKAPKTSLNTFYSNVLSEVLFLNENTKTLCSGHWLVVMWYYQVPSTTHTQWRTLEWKLEQILIYIISLYLYFWWWRQSHYCVPFFIILYIIPALLL